jgi:lipopolysaccharide transport system permease protein
MSETVSESLAEKRAGDGVVSAQMAGRAELARAESAVDAPQNFDEPLILRATSGWSALKLGEIWHFRDLLFTLAGRDLKLRYKQTALGVIWVVLQPLMAAGIFTVVFGKIAKLDGDGKPYFVFAFVGQVAWGLFTNTLTKASGCLLGNSQLISKVYFPRFVLPLSGIPSSLIDFAVALAMYVAMVVICHFIPGLPPVVPGWGLVFLPLWIAIVLCIAMGIGLISAAYSVSYRDVQYILPVFLQMLMYASPVAYGNSAVPPWLKDYYYMNPLSSVLEGFRWSLLNTNPPDWRYVGLAAVWSVALLVAGAFSFKRMERRFADVI